MKATVLVREIVYRTYEIEVPANTAHDVAEEIFWNLSGEQRLAGLIETDAEAEIAEITIPTEVTS